MTDRAATPRETYPEDLDQQVAEALAELTAARTQVAHQLDALAGEAALLASVYRNAPNPEHQPHQGLHAAADAAAAGAAACDQAYRRLWELGALRNRRDGVV